MRVGDLWDAPPRAEAHEQTDGAVRGSSASQSFYTDAVQRRERMCRAVSSVAMGGGRNGPESTWLITSILASVLECSGMSWRVQVCPGLACRASGCGTQLDGFGSSATLCSVVPDVRRLHFGGPRVGFLSLSSLSPDIHPHSRLAANSPSSSFALRYPASASAPPVQRLLRLPGQLSVRREPCSFTQLHWSTRGSPASSAQPVSTLLDFQIPRARISTTPSPPPSP